MVIRDVHLACAPRFLAAVALALALLAPERAAWAARMPKKERESLTDEARTEYKAYEMLKKGVELIEEKQEERGVKLIASIPQMFPKSKVRFEAFLTLGEHFVDTRQYELAIKQFVQVLDSEDAEQQAETIYRIGICYFSLNNFDKAFNSLRRVTTDFPWSVFANEAYYYIGQCHFKLGRWAKAVEALKMVGTSVPTNVEGETKAEAGQRLFVKVFDRDLVVLRDQKKALKVAFTGSRGDKETIPMEILGQSGEYYLGSLPTDPGEPKPGDGILQVAGAETVGVEYIDENTEAGERFKPQKSLIRMVSTASAGFTDGAYRDYVQGVFGDSDCFLRVKDLDQDVTPNPDTVKVKVMTRYKVQREEKVSAWGGVDLSALGDKYEVRDSITATLTETGPHTGVFVGTVVPEVTAEGTAINQGDSLLSALKGDEAVLEYYDDRHMLGEDPRMVSAQAKLLVGEIQDVKIEHRVVDSMDLRARKNLIEAKIYLKLATIFKDVGLTEKANEKADQGLERVEEVISTSLQSSLERATVEEAFSAKWELLLVQDRLNEAIQVCRTLTQLFPDSTLVDQALLRIGQAKMENADDPREAISIFNAVVQLPKSDLKAEAQFHIALVYEKYAEKHELRDQSQALLAFKKCAETYPESPFAGEALDKIASFYISSRDYARAIELMERVCEDYPDASFLDNMLWKWVVAAYRMGNFAMARDKADQLLGDYPNSKYAEKVQKYKSVIDKKLGLASGEETEPAPAGGTTGGDEG